MVCPKAEQGGEPRSHALRGNAVFDAPRRPAPTEGRRAAREAFPRGAWERVTRFPCYCIPNWEIFMRSLRSGPVLWRQASLTAVFIVCCGAFLGSGAADQPASEQAPAASAPAAVDLPRADALFAGAANRTLAGSKPDFPRLAEAPKGAPNVLLVLVDDAGFGNPSTFGGPCQTPTLSKLASAGLRYNRFHVTALCSPSRAALLSGATTTPSASARSPSSPAGGPATTRPGRRARRASRGFSRATAIPPPHSASGTSRPTTSRAPPARSTAGLAG